MEGKNSNTEYTAICTPFSVKALSFVCNLKSIIICDSIHGERRTVEAIEKTWSTKIKKLYGCCCAGTREREIKSDVLGCVEDREIENASIQLATILCFNSFPQIPSMFPAWMAFRDLSKNRIWLTACFFPHFFASNFLSSASFFRSNVWLYGSEKEKL